MPTPTRELIELRLPAGMNLSGFVAQRRRSGAGWRLMADEVLEATGVFVSHQTLRRWFPDAPPRRQLKPAPHPIAKRRVPA
ncbi:MULTISPECIES: hypothetical protein [unclassified Rhodococcus (in: high G+C Gram-positive bacteria)]|uniref:hypothetical protein n=1 Tax=unclassified Rhodococcus (in: high G+C Gram-positive bacteria) TaxID=192944 RepID=UPI000BE44CC9|nr:MULTISPECIES: hypothetical protein [unclassified Rhodococcus (in: high G+C Gram-positive bacteria)]